MNEIIFWIVDGRAILIAILLGICFHSSQWLQLRGFIQQLKLPFQLGQWACGISGFYLYGWKLGFLILISGIIFV